jgi:branched-chain amino acid aminotransferase
MKKHDPLIWYNERILPASEAKVSVLSPTAQFGLNVFEGLRCYWNQKKETMFVFRLKDHLERLKQSCRLMGFNSHFSIAEIESCLIDVLKANRYREDVSVRIMIFVDGDGSWYSSFPTSMFIAPIPKARSNIEKIKLNKCCISSWQRINDNILPPRAKVGANYMNSRWAFLQAKEAGYDFPIFLGSDGKVSESSGSCLFIVRNNKIITPCLNSSILESITRDTLISLAKDMKWEVEERSVDRTEMYLAQEAFLCGSAAEICPLVEVDGYTIGDGELGSKTKLLLTKYLEIASSIDSAYKDWLYPIIFK